ncbi:MAG: protein tyrosine phosphatase [Rhizobiales bacterium]|nr:protein tyrosine phosphatase [Hyphomicrobiales bacterium]
MIFVTPLSRLHETVERSGARRLVTLLSGTAIVERPPVIEADHHLTLRVNDIVAPADGMVVPERGHVAELLAFAQAWDRAAPIAIHCYAGISRSTAAAYIVAAALAPREDEEALAGRLRAASPTATPNARLVALADAELGRNGRMIRAIERIGRGEDAFEGMPFFLPLAES